MGPERWNRIEDLFLQATELSPQERERFLGEVCNGDESLRRELKLAAGLRHPRPPLVNGSFLPPNGALADVASPAPTELIGRRTLSFASSARARRYGIGASGRPG